MADVNEPLVLTEVRGALGVIILNRPRAVNALNHEMLELVDDALTRFEADDTVKAVLVRGAGERGLCAGGDIVSIYKNAKAGNFAAIRAYFDLEYGLNLRISQYSKPYISLMDGLTLGGGIGISTHGSHRIVTEKTRAGMPETVIGFSPDIGALHILARAPHHLGTLMALTGLHVSAADAIAVGLADTFVPTEALEKLQDALTHISSAVDVDTVIAGFSASAGKSRLVENANWVQRVFDAGTVEEIYAAVKKEAAQEQAGEEAVASGLVDDVLAALEKNSPTGIKTSLEAIKRAGPQTLAETLEQDYRTANNATMKHDLIEGIRAQVVDKDRTPRWNPARFEEVSNDLVESFFAPLP